MTDSSIPQSVTPVPCPLCSVSLSPANGAGYHDHPANDCLLSGFEVSVDEVARWNQRAIACTPVAVPEGCTPADAEMLRRANHGLAEENERLRRALRPFARLVSTDTLSWAMVQYCVEGDPEKQTFQRPQMQRAFNRAAETMRELEPRVAAAPAAPQAAQQVQQAQLTVWYGSMPESNGKTNWTAILHRGDISSGITIDRSEYPDRVRYEADRMRWMIGELDKEPFILDYDADKHSGYAAPQAAQQTPVELSGVEEALSEGGGVWRECSGCYETCDGHPVGHYPYSAVLKCYLGGGCSECGGIGAVWDSTDYGAMADAMAAKMNATPLNDGERAAQEPVTVDLPERVIDKLFQAADLSDCGPDGEDILEKLHAFARNVVAETLARLPTANRTPTPQPADGGISDEQMAEAELAEFIKTCDDFADCGETDTPDQMLMKWANLGLLECTRFEVTAAGSALLRGDRS